MDGLLSMMHRIVKKLRATLFPLCDNVWIDSDSRCSFCLKGETLDGKSPAVIDYTPYLKFTQRWHCRAQCVWVCVSLCASPSGSSSIPPSVSLATTTWATRRTGVAWTAATARRASPSIPTSRWWLMRRAGATSAVRWSRGSRSSTPRRYDNDKWSNKPNAVVDFPRAELSPPARRVTWRSWCACENRR